MGVKKFIKSVVESLNISTQGISGKKKSLKSLLKKLKIKRVHILKELKKELPQKRKKELYEELELVSLHIEKGKKKLNKLQNS